MPEGGLFIFEYSAISYLPNVTKAENHDVYTEVGANCICFGIVEFSISDQMCIPKTDEFEFLPPVIDR